ncbi:helix-turn-helix domain-containing protein [Georgenia satyanarayanai]|uniref:helix-turn-helix domain-containing protein n=1 Tax=Georgenia satyanarayanai TaxID=860221 RepID=UPI00203EEC7A|nr:helix-turn-helix domain-containing protein [Georgenia satyanarayanai]MCM3662519.1 helix-turn-helix domain-containing protein [Georgenia satyanarayanai]
MPRYVAPPGMPPEVEAIIDVIGNRARAAIIRELVGQGPLTAPELSAVAGASVSAANRHLRELEASGLVTADVEAGQRRGRGRVPTWHVNPDVVHTYIERLRAYLDAE